MLDTKLKKTRRLRIAIISFVVLIPALILVSLYPQMEKAAVTQKKELEKMYAEQERNFENDVYQKQIDSDFVYMATETAYYVYAGLIRENKNSSLDLSLYQEYGWDNDYYRVRKSTSYYAAWTDMNATHATTNADWDMSKLLTMSDSESLALLDEHMKNPAGILIIEFNKYGELEEARLFTKESIWSDYDSNSLVLESMQQYEDNAMYWEGSDNEKFDANELIPKNFTILFALEENSEFCYDLYPQDDIYYISWSGLYMDTGAYFVVLFMAFVVALCALLLPFVKKLETGWERLFCMPFEIIVALIVAGCAGAYTMCIVMSHTAKTLLLECADGQNVVMKIIGVSFHPDTLYIILLILNFIGWAVLFFAEYIVVASMRQFLCHPIQYLKERILTLRILWWLKDKIKSGIYALFHIKLNKRVNKMLFVGVFINLVIMMILCCMQVIGLFGAILYSIILYFLLRKYGGKIQEWYQSLLQSTHQMALGNIKVNIESDLGAFQEMGDELRAVQEGFSKAVIEEARSQNMKTELITNVSHDLKTPLTAMITYIDLMKKEGLTEEERIAYLNILDQKSQRLKVLIEDLFEISKASTGNIEMHMMDVDVVSLMKEVRLEMEEKIMESDLNFKWNLPKEKIILSLDGQRMYRVFENLLNNILKYSMPKSRVYVDIFNETERVWIVLKNISADELGDDPNHLTERFVRGDVSRKTEGSGLGLAIAKSFIELQNGQFDISVDGDLFKVSMFWNK